MQQVSLPTFDTVEDGVKAGQKEENLVEFHWRTNEERDALLLAAQFGNRDRRRRPRRNEDGDREGLSHSERNRRNAARRTAKKSRKKNR